MSKTRAHNISMVSVEEAYQEVKANGGAAGVDSESIEDFERDAENKLYKIWNRMSSGSYFPKPVRAVEILKSDGQSKRKLGIPTVSDRIAQGVAKAYLEPILEPKFHEDSYGFRPGRSQGDALKVTRTRCFQLDWVIDLDIKAFFDNLDHTLLLDAVQTHTETPWVLMYIERWLKAPMQECNGELSVRDKGTPQGGVISPLLANIYLHHAFDSWMAARYANIPFERFADDIVIHCKTKAQAEYLLREIAKRLTAWKLELHPEKTRIVYCKDDRRTEDHSNTKFDFLGYTFQCREVRARDGRRYGGFTPAMSSKAWREKSEQIRKWELQRRTDLSIDELADLCNPQIRGWRYYGMFTQAKLRHLLNPINFKLVKWAQRKYRLNKHGAVSWLKGLCLREPNLFAHWEIGLRLSRRIGAV